MMIGVLIHLSANTRLFKQVSEQEKRQRVNASASRKKRAAKRAKRKKKKKKKKKENENAFQNELEEICRGFTNVHLSDIVRVSLLR